MCGGVLWCSWCPSRGSDGAADTRKAKVAGIFARKKVVCDYLALRDMIPAMILDKITCKRCKLFLTKRVRVFFFGAGEEFSGDVVVVVSVVDRGFCIFDVF